jgi:hypothetical protein
MAAVRREAGGLIDMPRGAPSELRCELHLVAEHAAARGPG